MKKHTLYRLLVTLAIGALGAYFGPIIHIPGGALTGALCATAIANLLQAPLEQPPSWLRSVARGVLGLSLGVSVTMETIQVIGQTLAPVLLMVLMLLAMSLVTALVIHRLTRLPLPTALCGSAPGALGAMVSLAEDLGGDAPMVASMHMVRLVSVLLFMPAFVVAMFGSGDGATAVLPVAAVAPDGSAIHLAILLALGTLAGFVSVRLKVPAGEMIACMALAAIISPIWLHLDRVPGTWRFFAQWIIGAGVGSTVTRETLRHFKPFALAGALMTVFLIGLGLGLGWLLAQITSLDLVTCIIGSSPGGADTMIILAGELGANVQLVAAMHIARMILLMLLLPILVRLANERIESKGMLRSSVDAAD